MNLQPSQYVINCTGKYYSGNLENVISFLPILATHSLTRQNIYIYRKQVTKYFCVASSVAGPFHFDLDPDPELRIHFRENWIRIQNRLRPSEMDPGGSKFGSESELKFFFDFFCQRCETMFFSVIYELVIHVY